MGGAGIDLLPEALAPAKKTPRNDWPLVSQLENKEDRHLVRLKSKASPIDFRSSFVLYCPSRVRPQR
jgi:hypothetical protein